MRKKLGFASVLVFFQELKQHDHEKCLEYSESVLQPLKIDQDFSRKFVYSHKTYFRLNDFVNNQNCRIRY